MGYLAASMSFCLKASTLIPVCKAPRS